MKLESPRTISAPNTKARNTSQVPPRNLDLHFIRKDPLPELIVVCSM